MFHNEDSIFGPYRRLKLVGITYNQIESGVYAVILQEVGGERRIPIIIGFPEAQSIECKLQDIVPPRPLTHDLMKEIMDTYHIKLDYIVIYRMPSGVFGARLMLNNDGHTEMIDARSSDGIALAIRMDAPILTLPEVLDEVGFIPEQGKGGRMRRSVSPQRAGAEETPAPQQHGMSLEEMRRKMQIAAEEEDYETAARLKSMIDDIEKANQDTNPENQQ